MQKFYENNLDASAKHAANAFPHTTATAKLSDMLGFDAEDFSVPTKSDYNSYHLNWEIKHFLFKKFTHFAKTKKFQN